MCKITRKSMLYKTGVEYGDYTMNHVLGCSHGCKFPCYAFMQKKRFGQIKSYNEWCQPCLVTNTIELLEKEIPKLKNKIESVHLCFMTDPFMYGFNEIAKMSIEAIKLLNKNEIKCKILTKGILPEELIDETKFLNTNEYGITLVSYDEQFRRKFEPGSSPYTARLEALRYLHNNGCKTWVSIEPFPTPNVSRQNLDELLDIVGFVDKIIFGRTNYSSLITKGCPYHKKFYNNAAQKVIDFCKTNDIACIIKNKTITS